MSTLSVIIPTWSGTSQLAEMAFRLCKSIRNRCDEIVVVEDSKTALTSDLASISDIFVSHRNWGFTENVRLGLKVATGDYVAVINSDVLDITGDLYDLCKPGRVTSPCCTLMTYMHGFHGAFWVAPRTVLEEIDYQHCKDPAQSVQAYPEFEWVESVVFEHTHTGTSFAEKRRQQEERDRAAK